MAEAVAPPAATNVGLPPRFVTNVAVNYGAEGAAALSTVILTPVLLHFLGVDGYGVWVIVGSLIAYLELFELGFGVTTIKMVAEDAYRRPASVVRTLNTNIAALSLFGLVALVVGWSLAPIVPRLFNVPPHLAHQTSVIFALLTVPLAFSIPADVLGGALAGHQRYDLLSLSNLALSLCTLIGGVIAVALGGGLYGLAAVAVVVSVGMQFARLMMLRRLVPGFRLSPRLVDRSRLRDTAQISGWFLLRDITNIVINRLDLVVVGLILGVRAVAVYSIGLKLAQLGRKALVPLVQVFFPHASALSTAGQQEGLRQLLVEGTRIALLVAMPVMIILSLLASDAIEVWLGSGYAKAAPVLIALAVARGIQAVSDTAGWVLAGSGWVKTTALVAAAEAVVNLGVSAALARPLGVTGVALGTLVGVAFVGAPAALVLACRATGLPLRVLLRQAALPHLLPLVVGSALLAAEQRILGHSRVGVGTAAVFGVAGYALLYFRVSGPKEDRERVSSLVGRVSSRGSARMRTTRLHGRARVVVPAPPQAAQDVWSKTSEPPLVAVCVLTLWRPAGLRTLLESLGSLDMSSGPAARVVVAVVDNDPAGSAAPIVEELAARMPWPVRYTIEPTRGISYARNAAVRLTSDADFVAFIDDDEFAHAEWLGELLRTARRTQADIVTGPVAPEFAPDVPDWIRRGGFHQRPAYPADAKLNYARTSNVLVSRATFPTDGPAFPEAMALTGGEDTYFFMRANNAGRSIVWASEARVTESVPLSRSNVRWIVMREFRRGITLSACLVAFEATTARRLMRFAGGCLQIAGGVGALVAGVFRGRVGVVAGVQRIAFGFGMIAGLVGVRYEEYRKVHGE
ncbi:MAG: oligosaccharide flippase family protein [Mycobacteriales bacterium]